MKYIRTKNGIWEYVGKRELALTPKSKLVDYYVNKRLHCFVSLGYGRLKEENIIKQANTIEELCDGLIVEDKDNTNNWFVMDISEYQSKDNVDKKYMVDRWNFYAFIKTDKGLIYVAKMNENGELELL